MSTKADPKTRSFPRFYARVEQGGESSKGSTTGAMRYAGLIGAGIAELLHLKRLAPASVGDFLRGYSDSRLAVRPRKPKQLPANASGVHPDKRLSLYLLTPVV